MEDLEGRDDRRVVHTNFWMTPLGWEENKNCVRLFPYRQCSFEQLRASLVIHDYRPESIDKVRELNQCPYRQAVSELSQVVRQPALVNCHIDGKNADSFICSIDLLPSLTDESNMLFSITSWYRLDYGIDFRFVESQPNWSHFIVAISENAINVGRVIPTSLILPALTSKEQKIIIESQSRRGQRITTISDQIQDRYLINIPA